ncbi:hypothetical protein [Pelosinus fermentans]|uniref:Uncharacterized protein n=1 Tax=Pelosinus fermentans JBW45 TaxID=1192197 RepID=I8U131_9FIRM|nr:hypothetical protein [Pelosinus fermentans]AJQ29484.1 hypothetical protein JBW_04151 [Pelosinus fermentans JBW45]
MKKIRSLFYRILAVVFLLFVAIFLLFYEPDGRTDNTVVIIGKSDKFSEAEIQAAIPFVKGKFKGFTGCNLTKLWYDEEVSNRITNSYMHGGKGMRNGVKAENVLVLMSSFEVGPSGGGWDLKSKLHVFRLKLDINKG